MTQSYLWEQLTFPFPGRSLTTETSFSYSCCPLSTFAGQAAHSYLFKELKNVPIVCPQPSWTDCYKCVFCPSPPSSPCHPGADRTYPVPGGWVRDGVSVEVERERGIKRHTDEEGEEGEEGHQGYRRIFSFGDRCIYLPPTAHVWDNVCLIRTQGTWGSLLNGLCD